MTFIGSVLLMVKSGFGHEREIVSSTRTISLISALIYTPIFFVIQVAFLYAFLVILFSRMPSPLYIFFIITKQTPIVMTALIFSVHIFKHVHKVAKNKLLLAHCITLSVRLSALNNLAAFGRIFVKCFVTYFY